MASALWARLTWSKALFGVLIVNVAWTASLFISPFLVSPGSFANQVGGANVIDHENIWATFPLYPRIVYTIRQFSIEMQALQARYALASASER